MKIDQYIGRSGFTSRRKAFELIEEKRVEVNGKIATFSTKVKEGDEVKIDGEILEVKEFKPVYILYNKPKGIICTTEKIKNNIIDAIKFPEKIYPVGRLDKDSEGLILLTNDGASIDKIANPAFAHEKEYRVTLNMPLRKAFIDAVENGIDIGEGITRPSKIVPSAESKRIFTIVLTQGMNRQIRRMCNAFDYQVLKLQRLRVMHLHLGKLKTGEFRYLTEEELQELMKCIN